jgi:uncharacterized protein involved in type VI secretion and phage assembly
MAGKDRGFYFVPEVDDEVLVALEHGEVSRPYVIGALWNGQDKPPKSLDGKEEAVEGGKVFRRTIMSRNGNAIEIDDDHPTFQNAIFCITREGHNLRLSDKFHSIRLKTHKGHVVLLDDEKGEIWIEDYPQKNRIVIRTEGNSIEVTAAGPINMSAGGKVTIEGQAGVDIKSPMKVTVDGTAGVDVTSTANVTVTGTAMTEVSSPGVVNVQGTLVKIN